MKNEIIRKSIWIAFATTMFFIGLVNYQNRSPESDSTGMYLSFGFMCCLPIIGFMLRLVRGAAASGRESGARDIRITRTSNYSYSVTNNAGWGWVIGLIVGIFVSLAIGPFVLPVMIIINVVQLITLIVRYRNDYR